MAGFFVAFGHLPALPRRITILESGKAGRNRCIRFFLPDTRSVLFFMRESGNH